jgi:hypothetical protein
MIVESHFLNTWVFLRDGKVIDLSGMQVDEAARFVAEIERYTNQGVVIVEGGDEVGARRAAAPLRVRES